MKKFCICAEHWKVPEMSNKVRKSCGAFGKCLFHPSKIWPWYQRDWCWYLRRTQPWGRQQYCRPRWQSQRCSNCLWSSSGEKENRKISWSIHFFKINAEVLLNMCALKFLNCYLYEFNNTLFFSAFHFSVISFIRCENCIGLALSYMRMQLLCIIW